MSAHFLPDRVPPDQRRPSKLGPQSAPRGLSHRFLFTPHVQNILFALCALFVVVTGPNFPNFVKVVAATASNPTAVGAATAGVVLLFLEFVLGTFALGKFLGLSSSVPVLTST